MSEKQFEYSIGACVQFTTVPSDLRTWEEVACTSDCNSKSSFKFSVASYNVLAQCLLESHAHLYTGSSPYNLQWSVRAPRLFDEIINLAPDILCLQEVQASHLQSFYSNFERVGYVGIFKKKTGFKEDGCAIYFKQKLFKMAGQCSVEYFQPGLPILNRDNIGIMLKLVPHHVPSSAVVVVTTHLLYNPLRMDVKLAQIQVLLAEVDRFAYNGRGPDHLPIILTGDLNATPDSAVIQLLDKGKVNASMLRGSFDWKRIGVTDNCQHLSVVLDRLAGRPDCFGSGVKLYHSEYCDYVPGNGQTPPAYDAMFNHDVISHSLKLVSAYDKCKADGSQEVSTFQNGWLNVDYMYYSNNMNLAKRLRLPTVAECLELGCVPNDVYASDHFVLAGLFELKVGRKLPYI